MVFGISHISGVGPIGSPNTALPESDALPKTMPINRCLVLNTF